MNPVLEYQTLYDDPNNPLTRDCQQRLKPLYLVGSLVCTLRAIFTDPVNIVEPRLRQYVWARDDDKPFDVNKDQVPGPATYILIEAATSEKPLNADLNPAIIIKRGAVSRLHSVIGNMAQSSVAQGENRFIYLEGTIIIECISESPLEAELLASTVGSYLEAFGKFIMNAARVQRFRLSQLGDLKQIGKSQSPGSSWSVSLVFNYEFDSWWDIVPEAIYLRQLNVTLDPKNSQ